MELYRNLLRLNSKNLTDKILTTLAISFAILHIILYYFNRKFKSNLYFAIFLFLYALNIFFDYQIVLSTTEVDEFMFLRLHRFVMPYNSVFLLLFLYTALNLKIPKYFWLIVASLSITGIFAVFEPINNFDYVQYALMAMTLEVIRIFVLSVINKREHSLILANGIFILLIFSIYDVFIDLDIISPVYNINNGYPLGFLGLIIFSSIYLSRSIAKTNEVVLKQEREAKEMEISKRILEIEDNRKTKELNEARDLQLSLLPQCIFNIKDYDFCFDMRPATEVGGDYYDYSISEDNHITLVVGDATDHGLKAGMMVSVIKSLFLTLAEKLDIADFLNSSSKTIKQMKLKNMYMALMLIKIKGEKITFSSAGIPPLLIYRKNLNSIEEYRLRGMPLGALNSFDYKTLSVKLNDGDTVLIMTDGLPELFNREKETFGYDRIKNIFLNNANEPVNSIVNKLFSAGDEWRNDFNQSDDITFVAFRYKK